MVRGLGLASIPACLALVGIASAQIVYKDTKTIESFIAKTTFDGQNSDLHQFAGRVGGGTEAEFETELPSKP
jgi:hypothetical protein